MGFAISMRSDHPSAGIVRALWDVVQQFEDRPSMSLLGYPPHVTLAIYDGEVVEENEVRRALDEASRDIGALTLTFDAIRSFDGPPMVLWASPRPNVVLRKVHEAIHATIDPMSCRPHYRPGTWKPHCTLSTQVRSDRHEDALAYARNASSAFDVTFDAIECIYFPPIKSFDLRKLS
ncbi:MAG UNVERIFIED_CONTAM: 2'-5' RNA ligase family protein [Methylobacterium ajmalii]|uniref:2'-5' RNA ligase family protein n=1 Tax=Methylobacterium ajmalii TaxID=2738439 RepID=UPI000B89C901|nr:2'-5' RNA ligase family protein [Methylobacterium ajmalii]MBZ6416575.1 2'-5' RNA ligase family protein [Methylobacterium sp.]